MAKKGVEKVGKEFKESISTPRVPTKIVTKHDFSPLMVLEAGKKELFRAFYHKDTPDEKKGKAKWIAKPMESFPYTENDRTNVVGDMVEISIDPKYCGAKAMEVEAFMSKPTNKYPAKILIVGTCKPKLISTTWSKNRGGDEFSGQLKFGDDIWLNAQLEGCNGTKLEVLIYHDELGEDEQIPKTYITECRNGELNIKLKNTYNWIKKYGWFKDSVEKYYAIIKVKGSRTLVFKEKTKLLNFKFEISSKVVQTATTARPLKLGKTEINIERYETCRFKKISITDDGRPIELFNEDKLKLGGEEKVKEFAISQVINFDLDDGKLRTDAKLILDEIAAFLNENPYTPVELGAHCDIRADDKYNDNLSNERARSSVDYLVEKGIERKRISAIGYGKRRLLVNGKNMTEAHHQLNRRVTIKYKFDGTGAIKYQTVVPNKTGSVLRKIKLSIDGLKSTEHCFKKSKELKHTEDVIIIDPKGNRIEKKGTADILQHIYAPTSSWLPLAPLNYILPHLVDPNLYKIYINTCRYYSNKKNNTILVSAHPDIRWDFHFFINLTNDLSVKWTKLSKADDLKMKSRAGKLGAEARWKQTDIKFGALMEAKWNKISEDKYEKDWDVTLEHEAKIKQLYQVIAKIKDVAKYITGETKGRIVESKVGKKAGFSVGVKPPNFCIGAEWQLARGRKNKVPTKEIGTEIKLYFSAKPLVGIEIVIDLLDLVVGVAATAVSGGAAAPAARQIVSEIREWLAVDKNKNDGKEFTVDMFINLRIWGTLNIDEISATYHTAADDNKLDFTANSTIGITLEAGLVIKAVYTVVVAEFFANGDFKASATGSITFGHTLAYQGVTDGEKNLTYRPNLLFDGIEAKVHAKADIGLTIKKGILKDNTYKAPLADFEPKRPYVIAESIDIIRKIEEKTGLKATIPIV